MNERGMNFAPDGPERALVGGMAAAVAGAVARVAVWAMLAGVAGARAERIEIGWPTPGKAYFEGRALEAFVQPTASGVAESGLFGCRRSGGAQFHEGLDLKPVARDRQGEPADPIFAAMGGVVRYISRVPGNSNYGRYVVIEHLEATPCVYTLYAHLSRIEAGLKEGDRVERGQTIATMGRSSSGMAIPRERAHLHFEIGLWATREFQSWYVWKKFGGKNEHHVWNGMNLLGFDALDFFDKYRARRVDNFLEYLRQMTPAVRLRVAVRKVPDFVQRYPSLLTKPLPAEGAVAGWDISFNEMGVPFAWTPLTAMEALGTAPNEIQVTAADEAVLKAHRCKSLVFSKRGRWVVGRDLETVLQLVLGVR